MPNVDRATVEGFGDEWSRFDQAPLDPAELGEIFESYFALFPWDDIGADAVGFDAGCGSGRWAAFVAPRVGRLHCIDASAAAMDVARRNLEGIDNVEFHTASIAELPFDDASMDFGYAIGVLHHLPDPRAGLDECASKLRPGAPFLAYIYYALDTRPRWYRALWRASDGLRRLIASAPRLVKRIVSDAIAVAVYWPLARCARVAERLGRNVENFPLSYYRHRSLYVLRNDALDRFGTRVEHRFTRAEIADMMAAAGFEDVRFSDSPPHWCVLGRRAPSS